MASKEEEFLKRLRAMFQLEAQERIDSIVTNLVAIEKSPSKENQQEILETIFREAHSLKGAARSVNLRNVESICQALESTFAKLKKQEISFSQELFDSLQLKLDELKKELFLTDKTEEKTEIANPIATNEISRENKTIEKLIEKEKVKEEIVENLIKEKSTEIDNNVLKTNKISFADTIRVNTEKLDKLMLETEELIFVKLTINQQVSELNELKNILVNWQEELKNLDTKSLHNKPINNQVDLIKYNFDKVQILENKLSNLIVKAEGDKRTTYHLVDNLLEDMKKVLMLPFSTQTNIFPKLVRDISREQNKEIDFIIEGDNIEVDRRILEQIKDPLIHILRNSIDHGIETPSIRVQQGKNAKAEIKLVISQEGDKIKIAVSDNGRGINIEQVKEKALKQKLISLEQSKIMSPQETISLIFESGFSTSPIITDISGRGLGMAIVKEKVDNLGGSLVINSQDQVGTTLELLLPASLATVRGVLISISNQLFIVPTINVEQVLRIKKTLIKTIENKEVIFFNQQTLALIALSDILSLSPNIDKSEYIIVLVLRSGENKLAFIVDNVISEQEVLVKSLGKQLLRVRNISAATILGSGKVVPILNVTDLIKSAIKQSGNYRSIDTQESNVKQSTILVAEDSITARMLIKNILEMAGYKVKTAVDGLEAFVLLKNEEFDLVVSDIEMPKMNGFELTTKIRQDKKLADLPIILVTSLDSRQDREKGIDVGASAYIVKSDFEQSNLLAVVEKFI
ncbi:MAG: response regulator [Blastocatellia bacterium]|nr:response regulator [Blastocatellia bacterium]